MPGFGSAYALFIASDVSAANKNGVNIFVGIEAGLLYIKLTRYQCVHSKQRFIVCKEVQGL